MITGFATVSLWVNDFKKSVRFYRDVLGLELTSQPGDIPHFKISDGFLVLVKGNFCPPADAFPPDFPQLALRVDDLDSMAARLQQAKVAINGSIEERRDSRWIKFLDPDGNLIEIIQVKA